MSAASPPSLPGAQQLQRRRPSGSAGTTTTTATTATHDQQGPGGGADWQGRPDWLATAAQSPGVLVPSKAALAALALLPLLVWCLACTTGVLSFDGVPADKRSVWHALLWFDRGIFRTAAGPALPFLVLLVRLLSTAGLPRPRKRAVVTAATTTKHASATTTTTTTTTTTVTTTSAAEPSASSESAAASSAIALAPTAPRLATLAYVAVTGARMALYGLHLELQKQHLLSAKAAAAKDPGAMVSLEPLQLLSDHILLGASVAACLQAELVCAVSDAVKLAAARVPSDLRLCLAAAAAVLAALLLALVSADMHFTARLFHEPQETLWALGAGLVLFQAPLILGVLWLSKWHLAASRSTDP